MKKEAIIGISFSFAGNDGVINFIEWGRKRYLKLKFNFYYWNVPMLMFKICVILIILFKVYNSISDPMLLDSHSDNVQTILKDQALRAWMLHPHNHCNMDYETQRRLGLHLHQAYHCVKELDLLGITPDRSAKSMWENGLYHSRMGLSCKQSECISKINHLGITHSFDPMLFNFEANRFFPYMAIQCPSGDTKL